MAIPVKVGGRKIFEIYDYGPTTRKRAITFEHKEPETINWIDSFSPGDQLLDIGANIGVYSLYAASMGVRVVALEPEALNYALINLNIRLNKFNKAIMPYLVAAHNMTKFSTLNTRECVWGGALNSFDNAIDLMGNTYLPEHTQGVLGITLDQFLPQINFKPAHIKIDVDGNESLILRGAFNSLRCSELRSVLVELEETSDNYAETIRLVEQAGFTLHEKGSIHSFAEFLPNAKQGDKPTKITTFSNHIFRK